MTEITCWVGLDRILDKFFACELVLLSPPKPDFASKRSGAQECPAPNGALLSKRSEVASSCWRAAERPLYEKGETKEEEKKKHTNHTQVVALTIHVNTHQ